MTDWSEGLAFMIGPYEVGLTETSPETAGYWEGVARQELMFKRCGSCSAPLHPRRILCPECRSDDLNWEKSSGKGTIYTFSTIYHPPNADFVTPYTNGIIELEEGPYLFGRILAETPEAITVGLGVEVEFGAVVEGGDVLPLYRVS